MPRYVTIDLFGKVGCGKTTIFELFAEKKFLREGGNLSYDFRRYYARCWILKNRWSHSMVYLTDPKLEFRWKDLRTKHLRKLFKPTNILIITTDSTREDVENVKKSFSVYPKIKLKLIIFVIANMQDLPGRLPVEEIKKILGMEEVLGLSATSPDAKEKVEGFLEDAAKRYFLMLSKRGRAMAFLDEEEIGLGKNHNKSSDRQQTKKGKYSDRIKKIKQ